MKIPKSGRKIKKDVCRCRPAKTHRDCLYCGYSGPATHVCGVCKEQGIDGPTILGTSRVVCNLHKKVKEPGYTIEFEGVDGHHKLSEFSDKAIEVALRRVEKVHGKLPRCERTDFPFFAVYKGVEEIGGG